MPRPSRPVRSPKVRADGGAGSFRGLLVGALERRRALIDSGRTLMFRAFSGEADGLEGVYVDVYGEGATLIVYEGRVARGFSASVAAAEALAALAPLRVKGVYLKPFARDRSKMGGAMPACVTEALPAAGAAVAESLLVREVDWKLEVRLYDGLSTGVFLDQRENRAWVNRWCVARSRRGEATRVLNTFAYTCAFSVAAAMGGAETTSVDVSGRYLEWGKRNLGVNGVEVEEGTARSSAALEPAAPSPPGRGEGQGRHRFAKMDTFEFLAYAARKGLRYELVILDPPSFGSGSKRGGVWSSVEGYARLVKEAAGVLAPAGVVLASTNTTELCRDGGRALEREIAKGLGGLKPVWIELPPAPLDFAGERGRFAARAFAVSS